MSLKDIPDPNINWESIRYSSRSENIRPALGYRICKKCNKVYPINIYHFSRSYQSADGYSYTCKNCTRNYTKNYNKKKKKT